MRKIPIETGANRLRIIGLAICLISLGLLAWRVSTSLSSAPSAQINSPAAASVLNIVEPLLGAENIRVAISEAGGSKSAVVVVNARVFSGNPSQIKTLKSLVTETAGLNLEGGDRLRIEQTPFVSSGLASRSVTDFVEWLGLITIALLGVSTAMTRPRQTAQPHIGFDVIEPTIETVSDPILPATEPVRRPTSIGVEDAAALARQNPKQAARVVRGWLQGREDAA